MRLRPVRADHPSSTPAALLRPGHPHDRTPSRWAALAAASVPLALALTVVVAGLLPVAVPSLSVFPLVALGLFMELWALLFFALRARPKPGQARVEQATGEEGVQRRQKRGESHAGWPQTSQGPVGLP